MNKCVFPYTEFVSAYTRLRFGKLEYVNKYWRRPRLR